MNRVRAAPVFRVGQWVFAMPECHAYRIEQAVFDNMTGQYLYWYTVAELHPQHSRGWPAHKLIPWREPPR